MPIVYSFLTLRAPGHLWHVGMFEKRALDAACVVFSPHECGLRAWKDKTALSVLSRRAGRGFAQRRYAASHARACALHRVGRVVGEGDRGQCKSI